MLVNLFDMKYEQGFDVWKFKRESDTLILESWMWKFC